MVLTKTEAKILQIFAAAITKNFSLTDLSKQLAMQYRVVHRAVKPLVEKKYLVADNKRYSLNYKTHHQELVYIEFLRAQELLEKPLNGTLTLFIKDLIQQVAEDQFVLIIFGSTVTKEKPRDADILMIVDSIDKVEPLERQLDVIASLLSLEADIHVISHESVYEMLEKRDQMNVMNEILNKHVIVHGAEAFYRMLAKGRK